jgi:hypothetical protein
MDWCINWGTVSIGGTEGEFIEGEFPLCDIEEGLTSRFSPTHSGKMTARRSCCTVTSLLFASDASISNVPSPTDSMNFAIAYSPDHSRTFPGPVSLATYSEQSFRGTLPCICRFISRYISPAFYIDTTFTRGPTVTQSNLF